MKIACSSGTAEVEIGTRFKDSNGEWEVVGFPGTGSYSPSSLGGCPNVTCKFLGEMLPVHWRQYADKDGNVEWCGDSVAAMILAEQDGRKRSARGDVLTK